MDKKQTALSLHEKKFNCAQSVFSAFAEDVGIDRDTALKVSACFGGGMKCGEACGAVTGALMALGMKYGSCTDNDLAGKQRAAEKGLEFINKFREKHGALTCRDLLGYDMSKPEDMRMVMEKGLNVTICCKLITSAVDILEEVL